MAARETRYAFSTRYMAYDTGQADRQLNRVICIRHDGAADSKKAKETPTIEDDTGAGKSFSTEETDFENVSEKVSKKDIVVVVGELLRPKPSITREQRMKKEDDLRVTSDTHVVATTPNNLILVRRFCDGKKSNIFALIDKQNGLCRIAQVPSSADEQIVYYSEFAEGITGAKPENRRTQFRANITKFVSDYMQAHADSFHDLVKTSTETSGTEGDQIQRIDRLVNGPDTINDQEAEEAAAACKILWQSRPSEHGHIPILPGTLLRLSHGLRGGALHGKAVTWDLFRPFIISFCCLYGTHHHDMATQDDILHADVLNAYRLANDAFIQHDAMGNANENVDTLALNPGPTEDLQMTDAPSIAENVHNGADDQDPFGTKSVNFNNSATGTPQAVEDGEANGPEIITIPDD